MNELVLLVAIAFALFIIGHNLSAALLAVFPSLWHARETEDDGSLDPDVEPAAERVVTALRGFGFAKLGAMALQPPLARSQAVLVYGAPEHHTFADLDAADGALRLTLFTPFEGGQAVLTSDYQRPVRNRVDLLIGGLPQHEVAGLFAAHRRRVAQLASQVAPVADAPPKAQIAPWRDVTLAGRIEAERRFYSGAGKRLLRGRGLLPAVMLLTAVLFILIIALQFARLSAATVKPPPAASLGTP